ncbi:MAG: IS66 family transposase [Gemmatimonadota bacterium]
MDGRTLEMTPDTTGSWCPAGPGCAVPPPASAAPTSPSSQPSREPTPLESENQRLRSEVAYWRAMHRKAVGRERELKQEIEELRAKLSLRERQLFEQHSERGSKGKGQRGNTGGRGSGGKRGQRRGSKGHGRRRHTDLPVQEEIQDLPPQDQVCPCCGLPLRPLGSTEDSEVVEVNVRAYRRVIRRRRYKRTCSCPGLPRTITAPPAPKLIPKSGYGISFWVLVLLDKFLMQHPTYRLLTNLGLTSGLDVSPGTVTDGLKRLMPLFEPLYEAIISRNISESRWHADETRWMVFAEHEGKQGHRWYLWVFRSISTVVFRLDPSRSSEVPKAHFGEHARGILNVDRYSAYKTLLKDGRLTLSFCWAHVRRDFLQVAKDWPAQETWALGWVCRIGELYALNKARLLVLDQPEAFAKAQGALEAAVEKMGAERDAALAEPNLHPACRKVLESLKRHWSGLRVFVDHPEVPMDNNQAERDLRNPVVGRKNYGGSGSVWSGRLMVMLLTLLQTLLHWRINPRRWLTAYLELCAEHGGKAPASAVDLLPWNLDKARREDLSKPVPSGPDTS